jgi:hypothetical protein
MTGQNMRIFWALASGMLVLSLVTTMAGPSPAWAESRRHRSHFESQRPRIGEPRHVQRQPLQHRPGVPQRLHRQHSHHGHGHHHHHGFGYLGFHFFGYPYLYSPYYYSPYYYSPYYGYGPYAYELYAPGEHRYFPAFRLPGFFHYPGAIGKGEEGFQAASPQERYKSQDLVVPLDTQRER